MSIVQYNFYNNKNTINILTDKIIFMFFLQTDVRISFLSKFATS